MRLARSGIFLHSINDNPCLSVKAYSRALLPSLSEYLNAYLAALLGYSTVRPPTWHTRFCAQRSHNSHYPPTLASASWNFRTSTAYYEVICGCITGVCDCLAGIFCCEPCGCGSRCVGTIFGDSQPYPFQMRRRSRPVTY